MKMPIRLRQWAPQVGWVTVGALLALVFTGLMSLGGSSQESSHEAAEHLDAAEDATWTCSMHPQVRKSEPGQCPICGMDLVPVESSAHSGDPGQIVLSDRARALARLRTTLVHRRGGAASELRLLGRIQPNETTRRTVTAWTGGRIERLHVNVTGQHVHAGQVIATLFSPEIYAAHQDLLVAKRQAQKLAQGPESTSRAAQAVLDAARERLRLLGVPDPQLARMEEQDRPTRSVAIFTPFGGTVIERLASEGAYVDTGTPLYRLADLDTLWVQLDAYESDLARIAEGQEVLVQVDALPGETFTGRVTFIDPTLNQQTRTAQVRVEISNEEGRLRPGMFAEAVVRTPLADDSSQEPLVIPDTAPLFTGKNSVVYVEHRTPERIAYEPRTVRLGPKVGREYPVVAGLSEGERVVSRGAFAVDADLQIRGGPSMMTHAGGEQASAWDEAIPIPAAERAKLAPLIDGYLAMQKALAADALQDTKTALVDFRGALGSVELQASADAQAAYSELRTDLAAHAARLEQAANLEAARTSFEGLSEGVTRLLQVFGNPLDHTLSVAYCPMAFGSQGASWVQADTTIDNSYFGESMRSCGEVQERVAPGSFLEAGAEQPEIPATGEPAVQPGGHQH